MQNLFFFLIKEKKTFKVFYKNKKKQFPNENKGALTNGNEKI
jgi:hypothetical protein